LKIIPFFRVQIRVIQIIHKHERDNETERNIVKLFETSFRIN